MHADHPLWRTVADMAVQAASADPRFRPLAQNELGYADIEISALSPLKRVHPEVVEVGRHGLFVSCAKRRGLLLPQVATQFSWSRESFLNETCRKAGLPLDAWQRDDAIVCVFEAEVFSDVILEDD